MGDRYIGAPDRAAAYPSNTWEYVNARTDRGYTYCVPLTPDMDAPHDASGELSAIAVHCSHHVLFV